MESILVVLSFLQDSCPQVSYQLCGYGCVQHVGCSG